MKKFIFLLYFLILCISVNGQRNMQKIIVKSDTIEVYNTDLIVKVLPGYEGKVEKFFMEKKEIAFLKGKNPKHYQKVKVNKAEELLKIKDKLEKTKYFEFVDFNILCTPDIVTPNDTYYSSGMQYAIDKIKLPDAWDITTGSNNVLVGILDSGIPKNIDGFSHIDLNSTSKFYEGIDATDENDGVKDGYGHGTHVLGIAGALSNNSNGISGTNWNSKFRISQVFDNLGKGSAEFLYDAIIDAVDNNVKVINYSGGSEINNSLYAQAISYAKDNDVLVVVSVGNSYGGMVKYPAALSLSYDNIIAVSATNAGDVLASFSSVGSAVTVSAPGGSNIFYNARLYCYFKC